MEKNTITKLNKQFEKYSYEQDGIEYWLTRELQELLGYTKWCNYLNAINKAQESCKTSGDEVSNHFIDVNKTILMPIGFNEISRSLFVFFYSKNVAILKFCSMFAVTVHTTLPLRTASQGVSFAFIACHNVVALPFFNAHLATLFYYTNTRLA